MSIAMGAAFAGGAASALCYLAMLGGTLGAFILGYLAALPLFLVGLGIGPVAVTTASAFASLLVFAAVGSSIATLVFLLANALPVVLVTRRVLQCRPIGAPGQAGDGTRFEWYPPGPMLFELTVIATGLMLAAFLMFVTTPGGLPAAIDELLAGSLGEVTGLGGPGGDTGAAAGLRAGLAMVLPGATAVSWLLMVVINGTLAQGLLMRFSRQLRPPMRLSTLVQPPWLSAAVMGFAVASQLVPGQVGIIALNLAVVLAAPVLFLGLAVLHSTTRSRPARTPFLVAAYLFIGLFGWPALVVIGLGMADQWFDLRRRFPGGTGGGEMG